MNTYGRQMCSVNSPMLEPTTLGWSREANGELMPVLTRVSLAPQSVLRLVKCGCVKSSCSRRCSCREHNIQCTELCTCEADPDTCTNMDTIPDHESDTDDEQ